MRWGSEEESGFRKQESPLVCCLVSGSQAKVDGVLKDQVESLLHVLRTILEEGFIVVGSKFGNHPPGKRGVGSDEVEIYVNRKGVPS